MTARFRTYVLLCLLAGTALTGCSGSERPASSSAGDSAVRKEAAPAAAGRPGAGADGGAEAGAGIAAGTGVGLALTRDVVRTASVAVEVPDLRAAADRARALAEDAGGGLEAEDASASSAVLRLRVAPDRLSPTLDALARLGRETSRTVGSEDVSEQVADLGSRLATQRASVERVRALLDKAQALSDIVALEGQLAAREADLESLQARAKALREKADLATVTVTLERPAVVSAAGFGDGLSSGVAAFARASRVAAVVAGALLPFLPLLALGWWVVRRLSRRPAPPPAPPATAPAG